jgi:hypothetical protein
MFRQLAFQMLPLNASLEDRKKVATDLLSRHPFEIAMALETVWNNRSRLAEELGTPGNRSNLAGLPFSLPPVPNTRPIARVFTDVANFFFRWDHLIYAFMIENTRVYEIFRRVLHELVHGEKLGTPTPEAAAWLRTTEELFYDDTAPFRINNLASHLRPDLRAIRRNAYQRMFSMDLNHGADDGKPYSYVRAEAANTEFVATLEELLREVWIGMTYVTATSSSNPTDDSKISELAEKLHGMLLSRRQSGNLSREEFDAVATMSWFHLTLEYESPIVHSLRAEATGVEQRLFKIAERVGLPAHGLSKNFFDIADPLSRFLTQIETGVYNDATHAAALYTRVAGGGPESDLRTIITHWTAITGHDVKARKVASSTSIVTV